MTGKEKCTLLKSIRCLIAQKNGIAYSSPECIFQGECKGTCPKCEAELRALTAELERLKRSGKRVAVAGLAAAMVATSASACAPTSPEEQWEAGVDGFVEVIEGDVGVDYPYKPSPDSSDYELEGNTLAVPHLSTVLQMNQEELLTELSYYSRTMLQASWSTHWTEQREDADVYVLDGKTLALTFNESGKVQSALFSEDE